MAKTVAIVRTARRAGNRPWLTSPGLGVGLSPRLLMSKLDTGLDEERRQHDNRKWRRREHPTWGSDPVERKNMGTKAQSTVKAVNGSGDPLDDRAPP
jgi:hypothetical protein